MQRRAWIFVAWAGLTGISVLIATQAVGMVRNQVTESPATIATVPAEIVAAPVETKTTSTTTTTTTVVPPTVPSTTTSLPETSTVPESTSPTTTIAPPATTTAPATTTTAPPSTSTTTTTTTSAPPPAMETKTYQLEGGWVRLRYGGDQVRLVDAAPNAGYSIEIKQDGPKEVEVEFDGDGYEGELSAKMRDGELVVEIEDGKD